MTSVEVRPESGNRLQGRWTQLVPVERDHYDFLWQLASNEDIPWRWQGHPISQETFLETLWSGVLAQFAILEAETRKPIGIISAYNANLFHGHVYVQVLLAPAYVNRGWPLECLTLFVDYMFNKYGLLRKLYGEMPGNGTLTLPTGFLEHEATLKDHLVVGNETADLHILSLTRDAWYSAVQSRAYRIIGRTNSGDAAIDG